MSKIVIIGFGSAGFAALMAARKEDPKSDIIIIDPKKQDLLHPCGLPYALEGKVDPGGLTQDIHLERMKVKKISGRAEAIDPARKIITTVSAEGTHEVSYDRCLICPGSRALVPPIPGASDIFGKGLFTLTSKEDLDALMLHVKKAKEAVVIGAGAIGLETAVALKAHLDKVTVIEMQDGVLPGVLDPDMGKTAAETLAEEGVTLMTGSAVDDILGTESVTGVVVSGKEVKADLVVLSAGFAPLTDLAESAGLETSSRGIKVNERMETSVPDIYAAGDCAATVSVIDQKEIGAKLATSAYRQGIVAGTCLAGGEASYRGSAGTFVTTIGSLEVAGTGFTAAEALERGFEIAAGKIKTYQLPEYFPGGDDIQIKVLVDKKSRRIIGGQALGKTGAASRINLISMAIEFGVTLDDFTRTEMAYCPAVSEVDDPLMKACDFAARRMKK